MTEERVIFDSISSLFFGFIQILMLVKAFFETLLEVNYKVMSVLLQFCADFLRAVWAVLDFIYVVVSTVIVCLIDFFLELTNFVAAFLNLLWKIVILVFSLLDLLFHLIESLVYFLWTGGQWTAGTIKISGQSLSDNGINTWKYFVSSIKEFTNSLIGGFNTIGIFAKSLTITLYDVFFWCYDQVYGLVLYMDFSVRYACRYCFETSYSFVSDYLLKMSKEAFLGVVISCFICVLSKNLIHRLCSQGLTFPMSEWFSNRSFIDEYDSDFEEVERDRERGEFSDDEDSLYQTVTHYDMDDNHDEYSVNSDISDESDDEDDDDNYDYGDENSDDELEVISDSDESNGESESELNEINIQLPHSGHHVRRSVTPSRLTKDMSVDDLHKVVESEKEKRLCVVCQDRTKSVLILPCRHMCVCVECGNSIARARTRERRKCPLCRSKINTIMNVYV